MDLPKLKVDVLQKYNVTKTYKTLFVLVLMYKHAVGEIVKSGTYLLDTGVIILITKPQRDIYMKYTH